MFKILNIKGLRFIYIFNKFGFRIGVFQPKHIFSCTKMDQSGPNKKNGNEWTEQDHRGPNWTEVDRMTKVNIKGPIWSE